MSASKIYGETPTDGLDLLPGDFVSSDAADLACHMNHCAGSHSPFFAMHAALQSAHSVISPRIVTVAAIATIAAMFLGLLAAA